MVFNGSSTSSERKAGTAIVVRSRLYNAMTSHSRGLCLCTGINPRQDEVGTGSQGRGRGRGQDPVVPPAVPPLPTWCINWPQGRWFWILIQGRTEQGAPVSIEPVSGCCVLSAMMILALGRSSNPGTDSCTLPRYDEDWSDWLQAQRPRRRFRLI